MEIIAKSNQTVIDLAIMASGVADAYQFALDNGISITDDLQDLQTMNYNGQVEDRRVFDLYSANNIMPATAIKEDKKHRIFDRTFDKTFP